MSRGRHQRERAESAVQTKATEKKNLEKVGWVFKFCGVRYGGDGSACKGASLGLKQGLAGWRDHGLDVIGHRSVRGCGCLLFFFLPHAFLPQ